MKIHKALTETDLGEYNFEGVLIKNITFYDQRFINTCFENVTFERCHFRKCTFQNVSFYKANISNTGDLMVWDSVDIRSCDFSEVKMGGFHMRQSFIYHSNFNNADLSHVNFGHPSFIECDFSESKLSITDFTYSSLYSCNFLNADMEKCLFGNTSLFDSNITKAKNVDSSNGHQGMIHWRESLISMDTLTDTETPAHFLKGIGMSDTVIDYLPSLANRSPIKMDSCFISYSHKDEGFAKKIYERLRKEGVSVWYAPADMQGGKKIPNQIDSAIHIHDRLLLILSDKSIASSWVKEEIYLALKKEKELTTNVLFPISILENFDTLKKWSYIDPDTGDNVPRTIREYYIPNFSEWENDEEFEESFSQLLESLIKNQ
ncbi:MAG: hypothetical protein ACJA2E_001083 [Arenicella sp.]